jgi:hypothetical protein
MGGCEAPMLYSQSDPRSGLGTLGIGVDAPLIVQSLDALGLETPVTRGWTSRTS